MEIKNTGLLNPMEQLKQQYSGNAIVQKYDDWNTFANQGKLGDYIGTLDAFEKAGGTLSGLQQVYKPDFLSSEERLIAMGNEAVGDREKLVKKTKEVFNEQTKQYEEQEYETTEYEYTKSLLNDIANARELTYVKQTRNDTVTANDVLRTLAAFPMSVIKGFAEGLNDMPNFLEGVVRGLDSWVKSGDASQFDKGFREAFSNDVWLDSMTDLLRDVITDPETGDYVTKSARYLESAGDSLGRMIPTILLQAWATKAANYFSNIAKIGVKGAEAANAAAIASKAFSTIAKSTQVYYYASMASSNLKESFNDPQLCTRPTAELMANAMIKAGFEYGVERALGKAFGATAIDSMAFGYTKAAGKIGSKSAIRRILKDALQEGTEEFLQDYSGYLVDRVFGLWAEDYKLASQWNMQVATDAFIMGSLMSLAGSTFRVMVTKRVDTGIAKESRKTGEILYDKKGEIKTKKLGKLASFEYYTNIDALTSEMEKYVNDEKLSREERTEILSGMYTTLRTLTDVFGEMGEERYTKAAQMLDAIGQIDTKASQYRDYLQLQKQEQKYKKSGDLAKAPYEYARSGQPTVSDTLLEQYKQASPVQMSDRFAKASLSGYVANNILMSKAELAEKAAEFVQTVSTMHKDKISVKSIKNLEDKKQDIANARITTVAETINKNNIESTRLSDQELKVVKDIFKTSDIDNVIVAEDGTMPVLADKSTLVVPVNSLSTNANNIYKTLAETEAVRVCNTYQPLKLVVDTITDTYKTVYNDANATSETAIRQFLYDPIFASTILYGNGNKDMIKFIETMNNIINTMSSENALDAIQKKELADRQADLKRVLKQYIITQQNADYNTLAIFTPEEKAEIAKERYGLDFFNRNARKNTKPTQADINLFTLKVNSLAIISQADKDSLIADFIYGDKDANDAKMYNAMQKVDNYYDNIWTTKYNGKYYLPCDNLKNTTFNSWLNAMGITIKDLTRVQGLDEDVRSTVESQYGQVNRRTLIAYYQESFQMYTKKDSNGKPAFTFDYDFNAAESRRVTVKEASVQTELYTGAQLAQYAKGQAYNVFEKDKPYYVYSPSQTMPKLDIFDSSIDANIASGLTIDDAIRDLSTLSQSVVNDIKRKYNTLTSHNAYLYLNNKLMTETNNKFGIVLAQDGKFVIVDLAPFKSIQTEKFKNAIDETVNDVLKYKGTTTTSLATYKLKDLIDSKYVNNLTKDTEVVVHIGKVDTKDEGKYDRGANKIHLYVDNIVGAIYSNNKDAYANAISIALTHEFLHAMQASNNLTSGFTMNALSRFSDKVQSAIISDIKKHMPTVFKKYKDMSLEQQVNVVNSIIYHGAAGEAESYGYAFDTSINFAPWNIVVNKNGTLNKIVTPWGSEYTANGVIDGKKSKTSVGNAIDNAPVESAITKGETQARMQKGVRETVTKTEAKGNNLQYLYDAKKKEGAQVVFIDERIKNLLKATTPYMSKIDQHLADQIRQGKIRTKSDIVNYIVNDLPRDIDAKTNATVAIINRLWYKNENLRDAYDAEKVVYNLPKYYALIKALSKQEFREQLDQVIPGGVDDLLYGKHTIQEVDSWIKGFENAPSLSNFMNKEMLKYSEYEIDRGLAMHSLFNRYDGSLQSLMYVAETMKTYANPQLDWIRKPGKTSEKSVSLEQDVEGKRQGTDKTTTIADTVADKSSDIYSELGAEFLNSSLNVSRDEKVSQIWAEMKTRYIESLTKSDDYSKAMYYLSEDGPLYQKLENMSDAQIDKLYISYGFQDDLQVKQSIAERLANIAKNQTKSRARHQIASNIYRYAKQIRSKLTGKQFQLFLENANKLAQEQGLEVGFKKDGSYKIPRIVDADGKSIAMPLEQVLKLESLMKDLYTNVGEYTVTGSEEFKAALEKAKKRIERDYKKEIRAAKKLSQKAQYIELGELTIRTANNTTVPETFQRLLDIPSDKYAQSFVQYLADDDIKHSVTNMQSFQKNAADILTSMDTNDARQLIEFIKNSSAVGEDAGKFTTTVMQTLTYIYSASKEGTQFVDLTADELKWIESYMQSTVSAGGKVLSSWRQLCDTYNPAKYALNLVSSMSGVDIDAEYVENLVSAGKNFVKPISNNELYVDGKQLTIEQVREARFRELNQAFNDAYDNAVKNYKGAKRGLFEQLWKWQRMAMLSSPGTWVRNIVSNTMLQVTNKVTPYIGEGIWKGLNKAEEKFSKKQLGPKPERLLTDEQRADVHYAENNFNYKPNTRSMNDLSKNFEEVMDAMDNVIFAQQKYRDTNSAKYNADVLAKVQDAKQSVAADYAYRKALLEYRGSAQAQGVSIRRTMFDQYQITGTKIADDVKNFIANELFTQYEITTDKNGKPVTMSLYDMIGDALNKYSDSRLNMSEARSVDKQLVNLIIKKVQSQVFNDNSFNTKPLNELSKLLYKCLSDDPWVKKTFVSYLGKILTEDDANLTRGITNDIMERISDAYTMAAWDYMHKANFFSKMENTLRQRVGEGGFFIYKQFAPFAVAGWNWFKEGLNYTPIGLAKAIIDYARLDKKVEKMDILHAQGEGPTSRWASFIVKRNIGKGIIGTIGFAIGAMLAGFGVADIDDDDGQIKLRVGDVYIDISNIFGTQGILLGMVMANAFADDNTNGWDKFTSVIAQTLDQLFMDSTFMDLYSIFQYSDTFGEGVMNSANNILLTFYPNLFKYFNRMTYQHKVKYSSGFMGTLQRDLVQMLPGIAYAFPKRTDPYTGDVQYKYLPGFWGYAIELSNGLLPVRFKPAQVSDLEKEAIMQGVAKTELRGSYKDIGKFNAEQTAQLNEFYGKLNNKDLNELYAGKTKYKVLDKKTGKYVELTYKQMSGEQKKSVINRIMNDNAQSAKIYVYTNSGGKYYTTNSEELAKLKSLGIRNVYMSNKKESYFK